MKIRKYYDLTCDECGRSYSTDYGHGFEASIAKLVDIATKEGWGPTVNGKATLCPVCNHKMSLGKFIKEFCY